MRNENFMKTILYENNFYMKIRFPVNFIFRNIQDKT